MKISRLFFCIILIANLIASYFVAVTTHNNILAREQNVLDLYISRIERAIQTEVSATQILGEIILFYGGHIEDDYFASIAKILRKNLATPAMGYLPGGIMKQVYPLEGNENVLGNNILTNPDTRDDAYEAIETREVVVSRPYELIGGELGIVVRNPLFLDDKFIGFTVVSILADDLFESIGLTNLVNLSYEYKLISMHGDSSETVAAQSNEFYSKYALNSEFQLGKGRWRFSLYRENKVRTIVVNTLFCFFSFLAVGTVLYLYLERLEKMRDALKVRLEKDGLTNAYNRVKLENYVKDSANEAFTLFFIDLNKFKPVNDIYGHEIGDKLLIAYVKRLKAEIKSNGIVARIGGDEFVLLVPDLAQEEQISKIMERVKEFSAREFAFNNIKIKISASIGYAISTEAEGLDALLAKADERMYADKQQNGEAR